MSKPEIHLVVRDWDYLTPLAVGDVKSCDLDLKLHRVGTLPTSLKGTPYDAGEFSFSRYVRGRAKGEDDLVAVPHFPMRGFSHRCMITSIDSPITHPKQLAGKRVGLTGWPDSGHVWTRAILRRAGVGMDEVHWFAGRLTGDHPITDRLEGYGKPGRIDPIAGERPMVDLLKEGRLDAVFTPFMPPGFHEPSSGLRFLVPQWRDAEVAQYEEMGYVPGIHVLCLKASVAHANPWIATALMDLLDQSAKLWMQKRRKYADTTPWVIEELQRMSQVLPDDWNHSGYDRNLKMINDFCDELYAQRITSYRPTALELFSQWGK